MILCYKENFNITKEYINILKDEIGLTDFYGETALMFLCSNRTAILKKEIIEMLYNEIGMQDNSGETALMKYMKYRNNNEIDLEIIKSLSKEIGIKDKYNYNVLYFLDD